MEVLGEDAPVGEIKYMVDEFKERRKLIIDLLNNIKGIKVNQPMGAFYVFPDISNFFGNTIKGKTITVTRFVYSLCHFNKFALE